MSSHSSFGQNCIYFTLENCLNCLELIKSLPKHGIDQAKLEQFYNVVKHVLSPAMDEILSNNKSNSLNLFLEAADNEEEDINREKFEGNELKSKLKELRLNASKLVAKNRCELNELKTESGCLKNAYQNQLWEDDIKMKYIYDWMRAQLEQTKIKHNHEQAALKSDISHLQSALQDEYQVHDELENYYSLKLGELIQSLVDWVDKFERDTKDFDDKITELRQNLAKVRDGIENAKKLYQCRQEEVAAFGKLKEKLRLEALHMEHLNKMAIRIQAWWKGLMVRLKLGQYKVKKKKREVKEKKRL